MQQPGEPLAESSSCPPLKVSVTRMCASPDCTVGVGYGIDPEGRQVWFWTEWRCALAIRDALEAGRHVEVHLEGWQVFAWKASR